MATQSKFACLLAFTVLITVLPSTFAQQSQEMPLRDALRQGLVDTDFISTGNYFGVVAKANVINKAGRDLRLTIDVGDALTVNCPGRLACSNIGELKRSAHRDYGGNDTYNLRVGQAKPNFLYELCLVPGRKNTIEGQNVYKDFFTADGLPKDTQELPAKFIEGKATFNSATGCFEYRSSEGGIAPVIALKSTGEHGWVSYEDLEKTCTTDLSSGIRTCIELNETNNWRNSYYLGDTVMFLYEVAPDEGCVYLQDLAISKKVVIELAAGATTQVSINGFCIEANDDPPMINARFSLCNAVSGPLYKLLQEIDWKGVASEEGAQYAIWKVTDNADLSEFAPNPEYFENATDAYNAELVKFNAKVQLSNELLSSIETDASEPLAPPPGEINTSKPIVPAIQKTPQTGLPTKQKAPESSATLMWIIVIVVVLCAIVIVYYLAKGRSSNKQNP